MVCELGDIGVKQVRELADLEVDDRAAGQREVRGEKSREVVCSHRAENVRPRSGLILQAVESCVCWGMAEALQQRER